MPSVTTEQTVAVKLAPALIIKLRKQLRLFSALKDQIDAAKSAQEKLKVDIEQEFIDAGAFNALTEGCKVDEFPLKFISSLKTTLDQVKLRAQG